MNNQKPYSDIYAKKLMLRNKKDFIGYIKTVIPAIFNARMTDKLVLCFNNGQKFKFNIKHIKELL